MVELVEGGSTSAQQLFQALMKLITDQYVVSDNLIQPVQQQSDLAWMVAEVGCALLKERL